MSEQSSINAPDDRKSRIDAFARRHKFRWYEFLPWIAAIAGYFIFENYHALGARSSPRFSSRSRSTC